MSFLNSLIAGPDGKPSPALIIGRSLALLFIFLLTAFHLFLDFKGLRVAEGMDLAQISREIARGNGFTTKTVRPLALHQVNESKEDVSEHVPMAGLQDTYHAPLYPLLNAQVLRFFKGKWEFARDAQVYYMDRVVAVVSALLFLAAIGVTYLLLARIFDARIAGVTAVLALLCELLWNFVQSGLPQMLMLFLFSFALYFLYKGIESQRAGQSPLVWVALCGGFLGLLSLSNWLCIWIFFGALIFTAISFKPRGATAIVMAGIFLLVLVPWGVRNYLICGSPMGSAFYAVYNGLAGGTEGQVMRNFDPSQAPLPSEGIPTMLIQSSLQQLNDIYKLLGSIVAAPLFFLALLHPFKRAEIASFRWAILSMWICAVAGMSVYGLTKGRLDPNQLHVLFIPIMTGYGLAFLSVLWSRLGLGAKYPILRNAHFIIVILLSSAPLMLQMPQKVITGVRYRGFPNWPPYVPAAISRLSDWTEENEVVVSDVPWAVAWYADRVSVWLPANRPQFDTLLEYGRERGTPFAGVFLTPVTIDRKLATGIMGGEYAPWKRLILRGEIFRIGLDVGEQDFPFRYAQPMPIANQSFFYSDSRRWAKGAEEGE